MFRSILVFVALTTACASADPATFLPDDQAPPPAGPTLYATQPTVGTRLGLLVRGASPGAVVTFVRGLPGSGPCPLELGGACLDLFDPIVVATAAADARGIARVDVDLPEVLPIGRPVSLQAGVADDDTVTNVVDRTVAARMPLDGTWEDDFGFEHVVDGRSWFTFGTYDIVTFDAAARVAIARNGTDTFFPGVWSRFDWTFAGGSTWYCQTAYDAPTAAAALATPAADAANPSSGGCAGFAWSRLDPVVPDLSGTWTDGFGGTHVIDASTWSAFGSVWHVGAFSNAQRWMVARNDDANPFFPGAWSRYDWVEVGGVTYYCQTAYGEASEAAARAVPAADPTDPTTGGCGGTWPGGFAWTDLHP